MKYIYRIASYLGVFTLALYSSSQFKFGEPVELARWIITGFFCLIFIVLGWAKD